MLGQFVTDHPLLGIRETLAAQTDLEISEVSGLGDGDIVAVGGIIASVARRFTKNGDPYAVLRLEDLAGGVQVVAFPSVFQQRSPLLEPDSIVLVKGRVDLRGRELQLMALDITEPDLGIVVIPPSEPVVVEVPAAVCTSGMLTKLKETLAGHPGPAPVHLRVVRADGVTPLKLGEGFTVDASAGLLSELRSLLGSGAVQVERPVASEPAAAALATPGR
jgi:DNA polymerase-3 subunit alpha